MGTYLGVKAVREKGEKLDSGFGKQQPRIPTDKRLIGIPNNGADPDFGGRPGEAKAAALAARRRQIAASAQVMDDLDQVISRDSVLLRNLGYRAQRLIALCSDSNQHAKGIVRKPRELHGPASLLKMQIGCMFKAASAIRRVSRFLPSA